MAEAIGETERRITPETVQRDVPVYVAESVKDRIKARAATNRRSMKDEVAGMLDYCESVEREMNAGETV